MARKHPRRQAGHRRQAAHARHQGRPTRGHTAKRPAVRKATARSPHTAAASASHRSGTKVARHQKRLHHIRRGTHFGPPHQRRKQRFGLKHHRRTTRFRRKFRVTRRIRVRGHKWK